MDSMTEAIARNIKERRRALGLTQASLAEAIGYSVKAVSKWESGRGAPPTVTLPALAKALKTDIDSLLSAESAEVLYLGIDGGGTKTEFALANGEGEILRTLHLASSNPSDIGIEAAITVLKDGIAEITAGIPKSRVSLFAGLAGGTTEGVKERLTAFFESFGFLSVKNGSDAENIIAAGLKGENGAIIIMGTGSSCFVSKGGEISRIGGLGYLFDHGGSGYDIGNAAIRAAMCAEDKSGKETLIRNYVLEKTGFANALDNISYFYSIGKSGVASFSPTVFRAYDEGDEVAAEILEKNMNHIAHLASTTLKYFPESACPIKIAVVGGLTKRWEMLYPMIEDAMKKNGSFGKVKLEVFDGDVVVGALLRAGAPIK
jgi:N-acetylglucosamine kinase-like BadF-type ATPase